MKITEYEWVFENFPIPAGEAQIMHMLYSERPKELRPLGEHEVMLLAALRAANVSLWVDNGEHIRSHVRVWPDHSWDDVYMRWIYSAGELLHLSRSDPTLLGIMVMHAKIEVPSPAPALTTDATSRRSRFKRRVARKPQPRETKRRMAIQRYMR